MNGEVHESAARAVRDRSGAGRRRGWGRATVQHQLDARAAWLGGLGPFRRLGILVYLILWIVLPKGPTHIPAIRIAEERYARGEISATELERIRSDLQAAP